VSVKNLIIKPDFSEQLGDIMIWGLIRVMPGDLMDKGVLFGLKLI